MLSGSISSTRQCSHSTVSKYRTARSLNGTPLPRFRMKMRTGKSTGSLWLFRMQATGGRKSSTTLPRNCGLADIRFTDFYTRLVFQTNCCCGYRLRYRTMSFTSLRQCHASPSTLVCSLSTLVYLWSQHHELSAPSRPRWGVRPARYVALTYQLFLESKGEAIFIISLFTVWKLEGLSSSIMVFLKYCHQHQSPRRTAPRVVSTNRETLPSW